MGLLEDAIREHLELKRLGGADPSEVAREQHEALDPPPGVQPAASTDGDPNDIGPSAAGDQPAGEVPGAAHDGGDFPNVGQETAELDMQAVLDDAGEGAEPAAPPEEDSLEWEVPARPTRGQDGDGEAHGHGAEPGTPEAPEAASPLAGEALEPEAHEPDEQPPEQGRLSL